MFARPALPALAVFPLLTYLMDWSLLFRRLLSGMW